MIANILYQKEISRRMQSLYPLHSSVVSVYSVPLCEALKSPKLGQNDPKRANLLTKEA